MPLHTSSYFAGVATVVATMAVGFGGGVLMTDAFVGKSDNVPTLMERRAASTPEAPPLIAAVPDAQPAASQDTVAVPTPPMPAATSSPAREAQVQQQAATAPQPVVATAPGPRSLPVPAPQQAANVPAPVASAAASTPAPRASEERSRQSHEAMARANDDDVRKALAAERRKAERRKWTERRKREMQKQEELNAVAEKVRQAEAEREPVVRSFIAESPRIRLPGIDDDD